MLTGYCQAGGWTCTVLKAPADRACNNTTCMADGDNPADPLPRHRSSTKALSKSSAPVGALSPPQVITQLGLNVCALHFTR
jgi:hypothetical protein